MLLCRRLVSKEKAKEVSVEHVDLKKRYAVMVPECADPMLIRLDSDAGKIYCASSSVYPWTAHTEDLDPTMTPSAALARYVNQLIEEKDRKVFEFDTLFEFCSWVIDLKQERLPAAAPTPTDVEKEPELKPAVVKKPSYKRVQHENGVQGDGREWAVHYANSQNYPICGSIIAWPNQWRTVRKKITCLKCAQAFRDRSTAYYNISKIR